MLRKGYGMVPRWIEENLHNVADPTRSRARRRHAVARL